MHAGTADPRTSGLFERKLHVLFLHFCVKVNWNKMCSNMPLLKAHLLPCTCQTSCHCFACFSKETSPGLFYFRPLKAAALLFERHLLLLLHFTTATTSTTILWGLWTVRDNVLTLSAYLHCTFVEGQVTGNQAPGSSIWVWHEGWRAHLGLFLLHWGTPESSCNLCSVFDLVSLFPQTLHGYVNKVKNMSNNQLPSCHVTERCVNTTSPSCHLLLSHSAFLICRC